MRKLNLKGIVVITALTLSLTLTACSTKTEEQVTEQQTNSYNTYQEVTEDKTLEETPQGNISNEINSYLEDNSTNEKPNNETTQTLTFFKDAKQEISNYIESEDFAKLKERGKYYVTTGIDFIFFDQPINGIYFSDLKDELKEDVIRDVKSLDEAIMAYYPDYKEDFSSKYQVAYEFVSEKYLEVLDAIKDYLGEENYNVIGDIKDQLKEDLGEKKDEAFSYIKDKYQDWKNK